MDDPFINTQSIPVAPADHPAHPLVTVVIPTYNRSAFITEATRSVIAQSYTNWELIIADDGSTDGTAETICSLNDPRIQVLKLPHSGNIGQLRNVAAQAGKGQWICFLDSDDLWMVRKLELQLKMLESSGKRWGYGSFELIDETATAIPGRWRDHKPIAGWITKNILSAEAAVSIGSLIVERKLFDEVGGFSSDPKLIYREDYELSLRLSLKAEAMAVPEVLVRIREHSGRSTNVVADSHERTAQTFTEFISLRPGTELEKIARKRRGYHLAEAAGNNLLKKKYLIAVQQWAKAFADGDRLRHLLSVLRKAGMSRKG